jgi:hypothetical protein
MFLFRILRSLVLLMFFSKFAFAFHDVEVANEDVAALGGLWTQIYVYEEYCADNQYYGVILDSHLGVVWRKLISNLRKSSTNFSKICATDYFLDFFHAELYFTRTIYVEHFNLNFLSLR